MNASACAGEKPHAGHLGFGVRHMQLAAFQWTEVYVHTLYLHSQARISIVKTNLTPEKAREHMRISAVETLEYNA